MLSKAKFYSIVERIQHQHGEDDTTVLGYIFLNCTAPKSHTIALPWLVHTCSSGTLCRDDLSGGEALIQFCQQKNSHSKVHDWLTDHHVSIWSTESSQVKPSTSVLVLSGKSLLVTSMATAILWHYKQHPRDTKGAELQRNNTRLIFYSMKSGWSAWIMELLCFFSKLWNALFYATFLECQ